LLSEDNNYPNGIEMRGGGGITTHSWRSYTKLYVPKAIGVLYSLVFNYAMNQLSKTCNVRMRNTYQFKYHNITILRMCSTEQFKYHSIIISRIVGKYIV
jgi:hypothetical protein